jgi:cytidylate kinase
LADIIAIDGPAGAGKSTVARRIANLLSYTYLDTGAMYRAVAWQALGNGVATTDKDALVEIARNLTIEFGLLTSEGTQTIQVNGVDATEAIRTPEVSNFTSTISTFSSLREVIVAQQRDIAERAHRGVVLEGRDIGTVVFPNARLKVFLTATAEERAKRRVAEMNARGAQALFAEVLQDQIDRDRRDSSRTASPLVPAADAVHVSTDGQTIDDVVRTILMLYRDRLPASGTTANGTSDDC